MALTIEDGSEVIGADSYQTAATLRTYFTNKGTTLNITTYTDPILEAGLREATKMLELRYTWLGTLTSTTQPLTWPRTSMTDHRHIAVAVDAIPSALIEAQAEIAKLSADEIIAGRSMTYNTAGSGGTQGVII